MRTNWGRGNEQNIIRINTYSACIFLAFLVPSVHLPPRKADYNMMCYETLTNITLLADKGCFKVFPAMAGSDDTQRGTEKKNCLPHALEVRTPIAKSILQPQQDHCLHPGMTKSSLFHFRKPWHPRDASRLSGSARP